MSFRALLTTLLALVFCAPAFAAVWSVTVTEAQRTEGVWDLRLRWSQPLRLQSAFEVNEAGELIARVSLDSEQVDGWQFLEQRFDEPERMLRRVTFEGSAQQGFVMRLELAGDMRLVTRPQQQSGVVEMTVIARRKARRLARSDRSTGSLFVVEATIADITSARKLPKSLTDGHQVYAAEQDKIRFGFFQTRTAAEGLLRRIRGEYPDARVQLVDAAERERAAAYDLFRKPVEASTSTAVAVQAQAMTPQSMDEDVIAPVVRLNQETPLDLNLLDEAREAYLDADWQRAISLYAKAAQVPEMRREALEKLGVTRERNRQIAQAKRTYEEFLQEFDGTPAAERVRQRLDSLIGVRPEQTGLKTARRPGRESAWRTVGSVSQFYRRHSFDVDGAERTIPIDAVFTDASVVARYHGAGTSHEGRLALGHIHDLGGNRSDGGVRVQRASWDAYSKRLRTGVKLGRDSRHESGVLGRFDGMQLYHRQNSNLTWNMVAGYIVPSAYDSVQSERPFYGLSADLALLQGELEISPFLIEQQRDGILDRRAAGAQFFWRDDATMLNGVLDYDVHHRALNRFYLNGTYNLTADWRMNGAMDLRRSPYLTTGNALIGQRYDDLSELERDLLDAQLGDIAEDRTAQARSARLGVDGKLSEAWHLSFDVGGTDFSSTDASAGVLGLPERADYYASMQVRANGAAGSGSYNAMRVRYQSSDASDSVELSWYGRWRMFTDWFVYPRIIASQRSLESSNQTQDRLRPSLRVDYTGFRRFRLEAEVGYDWQSRSGGVQELDMTGVFLRVGYRAQF